MCDTLPSNKPQRVHKRVLGIRRRHIKQNQDTCSQKSPDHLTYYQHHFKFSSYPQVQNCVCNQLDKQNNTYEVERGQWRLS